jgi:hypothetical protein
VKLFLSKHSFPLVPYTLHGLGSLQSASFFVFQTEKYQYWKEFLAVSTVIKTVMLLNHPVKRGVSELLQQVAG